MRDGRGPTKYPGFSALFNEWSLQQVAGRFAEISGSNATAALTLACGPVLDAQKRGEPLTLRFTIARNLSRYSFQYFSGSKSSDVLCRVAFECATAESWGLLAALRWIDLGKPDTGASITLH